MRPIATLACLTAFAAATAAPAAAAPNDELWAGSSTRALRSSSANALTSSSLDGGGLGYARDVGVRLLPDLALWATAGIQWAGAEGTMFQTLSTRLDTTSLRLGARARYTLNRYITGTARLDFGTARTSVSLSDAMGSASDTRWGSFVDVAAGVDLLGISSSRFAFGLRFELGYVLARSIGMVATSDGGDASTIQLPARTTPLGALDLGGPTVGISLISQF